MNFRDPFLNPFSFYTSVKEFDRCLNKTYLETLSIEESQLLLGKIETFNLMAEECRNAGGVSVEEEYLITVGCRLSSDLSEEITMRLVDLLQSHEYEVSLLSIKLRKQMQQRFQASMLLTKAQEVRSQTNDMGETYGLGVII